jgi:glucose/arabinose dehydrogenase
LRNPVSIKFHPTSKVLWSTVQERDGLGDDLVPDFFTSIQKGAFYGWPYAYIGPNEEPRHKGAAPEMVAKTVVPDVVLPAHVAAMDFTFYTGKLFPARYRNGAFIAQRGSGNRAQRIGYNIVFIPFKNGKPAGAPEEFLGGWMMDAGQREVWGRPVGVTQLADGSLLVSEDGNNKIWHIGYKK